MLKQPHANFKKMQSFIPKPINAMQRPTPGQGVLKPTMPKPGIGLSPPVRSIMPMPNPRPHLGGGIGAKPMPNFNPGAGMIGARPMPNFNPGMGIGARPMPLPMPNPGRPGMISLDPREWGGGGGFAPIQETMPTPGLDGGIQLEPPNQEVHKLQRRRMFDLFRKQRPNPGVGIFPPVQQF